MALAPSPADFAALSSLVGTLGPEGLMSLMEAQNQQTQADLAQQTAEAGRQASQAQGAYQGLAAAPPPNVGGAGFVPQLLGNVASVLSENPEYSRRGAETVKGMQDDLMTTRRENLQSLRDIYSQRANLFEKAGDLEQAEKLRAKHESVSKAMEIMLQRQRMDETRAEKGRERTFEASENQKDRVARLGDIKARLQAGGDNVSAIADAIESGDQPPDVKGLYSLGGPVRAELGRRGYRLATAQKDWQAVIKHISTLNNSQQLRLRTAAQTAYDSMDLIDQFSTELRDLIPRGTVPELNRLSMAAAKRGAFGTEAAAVANKLDAQITDVVSEMGQVFRGGYAPTNEALQLAAKNLSGNWSHDVLTEMTGLGRQNLRIRLNSLNNATPIVEPRGGAAADTAVTYVRMVKPDGKTFRDVLSDKVPEAVAAGWKRAPR